MSQGAGYTSDNPRDNGIQRKSGEISLLVGARTLPSMWRKKYWTQMYQVDRFCGGKMSEFISNDFYFLNEV